MKKFIQSKVIENVEVLTDSGWVDVVAIHKTIPYLIFEIKTDSFSLKCADKHILFDSKMREIFVENLTVGDNIITEVGQETIIDIIKTDVMENMYDLELCYESNERYYTDGFLSHNTSYLKYLTKFIKNKDILFIPPSMAEMLSEPSIIPFLMEKRNSILLIEDGEKVITDRQGNGSSAGVSNILNLTDGILGDCLNIQVIVTFNMEKERIDQALLRKGRLIAEHKFDKLSIEETNRLLKHLKKDYVSDKPLMLADIYNIDADEVKSTKSGGTIGFKR
jgi:hypothetical protein